MINKFLSKCIFTRVKHYFGYVPIHSQYYQQQLPTKVDQILKLLVKQPKLNEKAVILQHLSDIMVADQRIYLSYRQKQILKNQINLWKDRQGRFEVIVTIAWILKRLNMQKDHQYLYDQIAQRVLNDEWYVNFDQSVKALETFADYDKEQIKNQILTRVERNVGITVWEVNMQYYKRIVKSLFTAGRFQSKLWDKIQDHILVNLGMTYSHQTITDIFCAYALSRNGTEVFFQMMQKAIYLGHFDGRQATKSLILRPPESGQFYALLVQTYSIVKQNSSIYLFPNFLDYIYQGISNSRVNYAQLGSFTKIIKYLPGLEFDVEEQNEIIMNLLEKKRPKVIIVPELLQFYDVLQCRLGSIPLPIHQYCEDTLISDINREAFPLLQTLKIADALLAKKQVIHQDRLIAAVQSYISRGFRYLQSGEAKQLLAYSQSSSYLPEQVKKVLLLPYIPDTSQP